MTSRLLPRDEWSRLIGTELESVVPILPETASVVVVEDESGALVGCWSFFPVMHVEGLWIAPAHRGKSSVGRRLWKAMRDALDRVGVSSVFTAAVTHDVRGMLHRVHAVELPGSHFVMKVKE